MAADLEKFVIAGANIWFVGIDAIRPYAAFAKLFEMASNVVVFEPSPAGVAWLKSEFQGHANVKVEAVALWSFDSPVTFFVPDQPEGKGRSFKVGFGRPIEVRGARGDAFMHLTPPNALFISVGGLEAAVVEGLHEILQSDSVRYISVKIFPDGTGDGGDSRRLAVLQGRLRDCGFHSGLAAPSILVGVRE